MLVLLLASCFSPGCSTNNFVSELWILSSKVFDYLEEKRLSPTLPTLKLPSFDKMGMMAICDKSFKFNRSNCHYQKGLKFFFAIFMDHNLPPFTKNICLLSIPVCWYALPVVHVNFALSLLAFRQFQYLYFLKYSF